VPGRLARRLLWCPGMKQALPYAVGAGVRVLAAVVALSASGCGDDVATFSDLSTLSGGGTGRPAEVVSAGGGSAAQVAGGPANVVTAAPGAGAGGATVNVESNEAGAEPAGLGGAAAGVAGAGVAGARVAGAGTAGSSAAGAPAAGGGAGGQLATLPTEAFDLIDDVEGLFPELPQKQGRNGGWFGVHDRSNGQLLAPSAVALVPARGTSHFAAGISGAGFTDWGAQLGVALKSPAAGYDASRYCGLRFLAKGSGAGWSLLVSDRTSVPVGGVCVEGSWDPEQACYDYVGRNFAVGSAWREVKVRFDELRLRQDPASARRLDSSALYDILFNFYDAEGGAFELLIDDLSFIDQTSAECQ